MPAAVLAVSAAYHSHTVARDLRQQGLEARAELAAARAGLTLSIARGVVDTLASNPSVLDGGPGCESVLAGALAGRTDVAGFLVADPQGNVLCSAGEPANETGRRALGRTLAAADGRLTLADVRPSEMVIGAVRTVSNPERTIALVLRTESLRAALSSARSERRDEGFALVRGDGAVLARFIEERFPQSLVERLVGRADMPSEGGLYRVTASLNGAPVAVVAASPSALVDDVDWPRLALALAVPLAMILVSIFVAFFGVDALVLRWVKRLASAASDYGRGDYATRVQGLEGAPREIAELGSTFNIMAERVNERSRALEDALDGKSQLLKELHHRVKNNFQMIASLLALQRRELPEKLRDLLRVPEDRVLAMAAAYKASYASGEIGRVALVELMRDVLAQLRQSFGLAAPVLQIETVTGEDITLDLDRAVPLGLLVSEILTAILEKPDGAMRPLVLSIDSLEGGRCLITIRGRSVAAAVPSVGLTARLVSAYLAQLGAALAAIDEDGLRITMAIEAPAPPRPGRVELGAG